MTESIRSRWSAVNKFRAIRSKFEEYKSLRNQADNILIEALERISRGGVDSRSCAREALSKFHSQMTEVKE